MNVLQIKEAAKKKRLINYIVDLIARFSLFFLMMEISGYFGGNEKVEKIALIIIFSGYYILMEYFLGQTIGKMVTKTRVVDLSGHRIDFRAAVIRYLCRWIPFEEFSLGLGYDAKAWHDVISKTYVIDDTSKSNDF